MNKKRLFYAIAGLLFGSLLGLLVYANTSTTVREKIEAYLLDSLRRDLDCFLSGRLESCNFATGRFTLTRIRAASKKNEWEWTAPKIVLSFSWLDVIRFHTFKLYATFFDAQGRSIIYDTNNIPLFTHIKSWGALPAGPVPVALKAVEIKNGSLLFSRDQHDRINTFACNFNACATPVKDIIRFECLIDKGSIYDTHATYLNDITGTAHITITDHDTAGEFDGFCACSLLPDHPRSTVSVAWNNAHGTSAHLCSCTNNFDARLTINPTQITVSGDIAHAYIADLLKIEKPALCAKRITYDCIIPRAESDEKPGTCRITCEDFGILEGTIDTRNTLTVGLFNKNPLSLSRLCSYARGEIKPHDAHAHCTLDSHIGIPTCTIRAHISEEAETETVQSKSDMHAREHPAKINAVKIHGDLTCTAAFSPEAVTVDGSFKNGSINAPHLYNGIRTITGTARYDNVHKSPIITGDGMIELTKGTIKVPHASISYASGRPDEYSFIFVLADCFVHFKKEMAACISGSLMIEKKASDDIPTITGDPIIETAEIKNEFLSFIIDQKNSALRLMPTVNNHAFDANLNLLLRSRAPLTVNTPLLTGDVGCSLIFGGTVLQPSIRGTIDLVGGSLRFPYQPLYITHGRISFLPHQLNNPAVEITACNKIKKYDITLSVSGFLKQPHIALQSSPYLSENNIITLLLGGSDTGSLYTTVPALLTKTLSDFIFGTSNTSNNDNPEDQTVLSSFKKQLQGIRIFPGLKQPESGSGLTGAVTVEVDDSLRATVQKNLNRSGESSLEVEYDLSDNTLLRAVKNEQGEIGAEIEKTWKFS